MLTLSNAL